MSRRQTEIYPKRFSASLRLGGEFSFSPRLRVSASKSGPVWFRLCRVRERLVRLFRDDPLPLNSRRTAFCECPHLLYRRHGGVAWKRGEQRAVRPTQINRFLRRFARKKTIEETGSKAVAPADAVQDIQFAHRRHAVLAADPGHRAPTVAAGGMHVAQRGRDHLDLRVALHHAADHSEKCARIELGFRGDFRAGDAQPFLQVFLVADEHVHVLDDAPQRLARAFRPARAIPELLAEVEIERDHRPGGLGGLHAFNHKLGRSRREGREDSAAVKPPHTGSENGVPIEVARLQQRSGFVRPVVEHHGRAYAVAAVAVNGRHVRARHAVVLESLVERLHAHGLHALRDQVADGVIDHGGGDSRGHAETIRQIGGDVVLPAADVNLALGRLTKWNHAGIQAVNQRAERQQVEGAVLTNYKRFAHDIPFIASKACGGRSEGRAKLFGEGRPRRRFWEMAPKFLGGMGWVEGFEPSATGTTMLTGWVPTGMSLRVREFPRGGNPRQRRFPWEPLQNHYSTADRRLDDVRDGLQCSRPPRYHAKDGVDESMRQSERRRAGGTITATRWSRNSPNRVPATRSS